MIEEHAESYEQPEQLVRWYYADPARLAEVEALVMEDNVVEWALGKMKVDDKPRRLRRARWEPRKADHGSSGTNRTSEWKSREAWA